MLNNYYHKEINIELPSEVSVIIKTLTDAGYEAYAVGGCVRDSILGKKPKDWDITTSAKPLEIKSLFRKTVDTGIKHGTVTVIIKGQGYEVTTYRIDGEYTDGRHPDGVIFSTELEEDLKRRDFTINAMAYNEGDGVVDCFEGLKDLKDGVIRCVGKAEERFTEDALRMLRALRFSAVLGFDIEEETYEAIKTLAPTIAKISRERIQVELDKLLMSNYTDRVKALYDTGLLEKIFEMPDDYKGKSPEDEYVLLTDKLAVTEKNHFLRWAVFDTYASGINKISSLKFDNSTKKICDKLLSCKDEALPEDEPSLRRLIVKVTPDIFYDYYLSYKRIVDSDMSEEFYKKIVEKSEVIRQRGDCLSIQELKVSGNDIKALGITDGKTIGNILKILFEDVLDCAKHNDKEYLLSVIKELNVI